MQQRVAIARALAREPQIMLMDEPFSSVDAMTRQGLQDLLLGLWREFGKTIVFVTHDIEEAVYLSSSIVCSEGVRATPSSGSPTSCRIRATSSRRAKTRASSATA